MSISNWTPRLERLLLTIWVGTLLAIGYLAVPVLFHSLDDNILAGRLAGQMFYIVNLIGVTSGIILLLLAYIQDQHNFFRKRRTYLIVTMLLLTLTAMLILQPQMEAIKAQLGWHDIAELKARFGRLHGVSSLLYLVTSVIGVVIVSSTGQRR